jgi:hypothetical protein
VIIHGDILLESEIPKQCFIQVYNEHPNQEHLVDYFECTSCLRNGQPIRWICKSCALVCHKSTQNFFLFISTLFICIDHRVTALIFKNKATG